MVASAHGAHLLHRNQVAIVQLLPQALRLRLRLSYDRVSILSRGTLKLGPTSSAKRLQERVEAIFIQIAFSSSRDQLHEVAL
jgi:hypothetical protein